MKLKYKAIENLEQLLLESKFEVNQAKSYPGLENETIKVRITNLMNRGIRDFISVAQNNGSEKDFHGAIRKGLSYFETLEYSLDTEDRERICGYFEEMMDIIGLESSGGILNKWLYGFDIR